MEHERKKKGAREDGIRSKGGGEMEHTRKSRAGEEKCSKRGKMQ